MEDNRTAFGRMPDGTQVDQITLKNGDMACRIITYGGAVRSLTVPGRDGTPVDVALGFDTLEAYRTQDKYMGAIVGRYANRIGGARFPLNGKTCTPTTAPTPSTGGARASTRRSGRWSGWRRIPSPCP